MYRLKLLVLFGFALGASAGVARAATDVWVLTTHPAGDPVTLGKNQTFFLRLGYTTDEPVQIWARPFFEGREVAAGSNPSRTYTGSGEALGWFFFTQPGKQVDEVRITAGDNLWPFEILQVGVLSLVVIGAFLVVRRFSGAET